MNEFDEELLRGFLIDSLETLDRLDQNFLELEKNGEDLNLLNEIFRGIHTIKGTAGFFEFRNLQKLAHVGESLLDSLRGGTIKLTPQMSATLLSMVDSIRLIFATIEEGRNDQKIDVTALVKSLEALNSNRSEAAPEQTVPTVHKSADLPAGDRTESTKDLEDNSEVPKNPGSPESVQSLSSATATGDRTAKASNSALRIDVRLLDRLVAQVGELVLTRNQLLETIKNEQDQNKVSVIQRLSVITSQLQEGVMRTRMQPIIQLWGRYPRIVRDLARDCGKQIELVMEGQDTELDKTLIEALNDPLTHLIRNSIDHGIELPDERIKKGKNSSGRVILRARHEGSVVLVEISDDGAGLNSAKIRSKATERGVISAEQSTTMSDDEVNNLIFRPGFSTASEVTSLSGRGVGMDVVRSNIEGCGGRIEIHNSPGSGCMFRVRMPLTLAIIPAITVLMEGQRYGIPQSNVLELIHIVRQSGKWPIEELLDGAFYRLRGDLLPIVDLGAVLGSDSTLVRDFADDASIGIVVVESDGDKFGIVVDEIEDSQEVVVKPLSAPLRKHFGLSGASILGDGSIALILNLQGLARFMGVATESDGVELMNGSAGAVTDVAHDSRMLLAELEDLSVVAFPLEFVTRIEEVSRERIEKISNHLALQYHGTILQLACLRIMLGIKPTKLEKIQGVLPILICNCEGSELGVIVSNVLDIVEYSIELNEMGKRKGVLGSAVIGERIVQVLEPKTLFDNFGQ